MGTHHPEGIFIARGDGIRKGASIAPVKLVDIVPTVLYRLGLTIPQDLEGRAIEEIFHPEYVGANRPRKAGRTKAAAAASAPRESFEDGEILERLKALGYIE